jgi:hypothetical protein
MRLIYTHNETKPRVFLSIGDQIQPYLVLSILIFEKLTNEEMPFQSLVSNTLKTNENKIRSWSYSIKSGKGQINFFILKLIKQLLVLSKKRSKLIEKLLNKLPASDCCPPTIYINRQQAATYCENPTNEADYHKTVFMQIYKQLKTEPRKSYNFRY